MAISQFPNQDNPKPEDEKLTPEEIEKLATEWAKDPDSIVAMLGSMLSMPDEEFRILAPVVLQSIQQTINEPTEKIKLVQGLNAAGLKSDDLIDILDQMSDELETLEISNEKKEFVAELCLSIINVINSTEGVAKRMVSVPIQLIHPDAKLPAYAHETDSGMDLYALEDITIKPGETVLVPTGIKVALPPGYELQVRPKSGRALKTKLRVANTPGTIDQGYRDEIKVIIENVDPPIRAINLDFAQSPNDPIPVGTIDFGQPYTIGKGEKFAQLVLAEVPKVAWFEVENVGEIGEDRGGGFGSSGLK